MSHAPNMDTNTTDRSENPAVPSVGSGDLFGFPKMAICWNCGEERLCHYTDLGPACSSHCAEGLFKIEDPATGDLPNAELSHAAGDRDVASGKG